MRATDTRIAAPRPPEAPDPYRFPLIASTAPVLIAVAIWAITGSMFALIFAALGPVTAIASFVDSRIGGRRSRRRELARFRSDLAGALDRVTAAHALERATLSEAAPDAATIVARRGADPYRWGQDSDGEVMVTLGTGVRASGIDLSGLPAVPHPSAEVDEGLTSLAATAEHLSGPLLADARWGIAMCGTSSLTSAWTRSMVVQLAWALAPDRVWYRRQEDLELDWMDALPHSRMPGSPARGAAVEFGRQGLPEADISVAVAVDQTRLSGSCRVIVEIDEHGTARVTEHPERAARQVVTLSALSREDAHDWAERVNADAVRDGRLVASSGIPERVELADLLERARDGSGLSAPVGLASHGEVELDLVTQGPHAVVGGTTGSGKSELLIGWVLSMAAVHSPAEVSFLLVDFKGGATFSGLQSLPHTVGTITDLDEHTARRALDSLRAELLFRERELARVAARSIDEHGELTRLVIVVDEFQAMLADYPELHTLFADIAARGRSLGVHLILCTQRPGGVVRDSVLANADLRVSLRVNNSSDSTAVVGSGDAALIPATARGRALVRVGGEITTLVQFAIADPGIAGRVAQAWHGHLRPRRPWCEPLSARILLRDLPASQGGVPLGMSDLPREQRQEVAVWDPASGNLLVSGGPRSGKTAALATVAAGIADAVVMPHEPHLAWELLTQLSERPEAVTLVIDDLDALLARLGVDYRAEFVERLTRLLREGPGWGVSCVVSVGRLGSELSPMAALFPHRLMLAHATRNEHVLAGGDGPEFREGLPPGGGTWQGARIQVALAGHPLAPARLGPVPDVGSGALAIVTARAQLVTRALAADSGNRMLPLDRDVVGALGGPVPNGPALAEPGAIAGRAVIVGDVDQWQAHWGLLGTVRSSATVVIHACSPADFRAITRSRELPPLLEQGDSEACWVLDEGGSVSRARLPLADRPETVSVEPARATQESAQKGGGFVLIS